MITIHDDDFFLLCHELWARVNFTWFSSQSWACCIWEVVPKYPTWLYFMIAPLFQLKTCTQGRTFHHLYDPTTRINNAAYNIGFQRGVPIINGTISIKTKTSYCNSNLNAAWFPIKIQTQTVLESYLWSKSFSQPARAHRPTPAKTRLS